MDNFRLKAILDQHELPRSFVYLAPAFPIVQVMWADGINQLAEQKMIIDCVSAHCQRLSKMVGGLQVVSYPDLARFKEEFICQRPQMEILEAISDAALEGIVDTSKDISEPRYDLFDRDLLMRTCLEIAAACTVKGDEGAMNAFPPRRIYEQEQRLIEDLFGLLSEPGSQN